MKKSRFCDCGTPITVPRCRRCPDCQQRVYDERLAEKRQRDRAQRASATPRICTCGKPVENPRRPGCNECADKQRAETRERKNEERRQRREEEKSQRLRLCDCGNAARNTHGAPRCDDCVATAASKRRQRLTAARRERRSPRLCIRCDKPLPSATRRKMHDECRDLPKPPRMCKQCGERPAKSQYGPAVCTECTPADRVKERQCSCGRYFRTRNNSTRCASCQYKRQRELGGAKCAKCGTGIDRRSNYCADCKPKRAGRPIGSKRTDKWGYVVVKTENGWIAEHTLVMERTIGRSLVPGENVHHKNGVRSDNRPDNLELWVKTQPSGQRAADVLAWAKEIIARYDGAPL